MIRARRAQKAACTRRPRYRGRDMERRGQEGSPHLSASSTPLVSLRGVSKRFSQVSALDQLELSLFGGEVVGLLGPNGAGKTTTLKVLLGLLKPSAGEARIAGFDCTRDSQRV